jgi:hypothetical protein
MMALPGEIIEAWQVRHVGLRAETGAEHEIASTGDGAIVRTDNPTIMRWVELRLVYASVEANVPTEAEFLVNVEEILADLPP